MSIHLAEDSSQAHILLMKGATEDHPEFFTLLTLLKGQEYPIDDEMKDAFQNAYLDLGGLGGTCAR